MPYTQEQIKEAKKWLRANDPGDPNVFCSGIRLDHETTVLAALEATQKERDAWRDTAQTELERAAKLQAELVTRPTVWAYDQACDALHKHEQERDSFKAYAAKLEKAGDALACAVTAEQEFVAIDAWDAARKEKP